MTEQQVLKSVEAGLERLLVKSDISNDEDLGPGLRIAIVYLRSRIDASIDYEASAMVDRALPAPEPAAEDADEATIDTQETATNRFEPVASSSRKRRSE